MTWRTIIVLAMTAALLILALVFGGPGREQGEAAGGRLLPGLESGAVRELRLTQAAGGHEILLRRDDAGWKMLTPRQDRADGASVEAMLAGVEFMRPLRWLSDGAPPSGSGLDKPSVELVLTSGGGAFTLAIGARDASGQGVFVRVELGGKTRAAVAPAALLKLLDRRPDSLRDHQLVPLTPAQIQRVDLSLAKGTLTSTLTRGGSGTWMVQAQGRSCRAVAQLTRRMLNALSALRAGTLHDLPGGGTARWLKLTGEGGLTLTFSRAGVCPGRKDRTLLGVLEQRGGETVRAVGACVDNKEVAALTPAPGSLQDLNLTRLQEPELERIVIKVRARPSEDMGGGEHELKRTPDGWTVQGKPVDGLAVRAWVAKIGRARGRLVDGPVGTESNARLDLMAELGGSERLTLHHADGGGLLVQRGEDGAIISLEPNLALEVMSWLDLIGR